MSLVGQDQWMMNVAIKETDAATSDLPMVAVINFQFNLCKGNAANIDKAGQSWRDAADQIGTAINDLQDLVSGISPDDWSADDRTAYEQKVRQACSQLQVMQTLCMTIGITLTAYAYALLLYAVFALGMGSFLAVLAIFAAAAAMGIVTAGIAAECEGIAAECIPITWVATAILAAMAQTAATVFQGGAITSAITETFQGNSKALGDLTQAEEVGAGAALANLGQNAINAGLAWVNRGVGGKKSPFQSVDLDADRNKDGTWDIGGTVTGKTKAGDQFTGGGHVYWGNHGWQGGDLEDAYSNDKTGFSGNGQIGYTDDDGALNGNLGTVSFQANAGVEKPVLPTLVTGSGVPIGHTPDVGAGGTIGESGQWNLHDGSGNMEVSGGNTVAGGTVVSDKHDVNWDHGKVTQKSEVDTPLGDH